MKATSPLPLISNTPTAQIEFASQLFDALFKVGVAYVPVAPSIQDDKLLGSLESFFAFDEAQKRSLVHQLSSPWQGVFHPLGQEHLSDEQEDYKEVLDLNLEQGTYAQWLRKRHQATNDVAGHAPLPQAESAQMTAALCDIFQAFQTQANRVLAALEVVYQQPSGSLVKQHGQNSTLRLLHYPLASHLQLDSIRLGTHRDYSGITLLWQDSTGGLEILTPNYEWVAVDVPPGHLGVIAGEVTQHWSGDTIHAAPHRVRVTDVQQLQKDRYAIAFFCETNHDCVVHPGSLLDEVNTDRDPIVIQEFLNQRYDQIFGHIAVDR